MNATGIAVRVGLTLGLLGLGGLLAACTAPEGDGGPSVSASPSTIAPTPLSAVAAQDLLEEVAITGSFAGLPQFPTPGQETGIRPGDVSCAPPDRPPPLVSRVYHFGQGTPGGTDAVEMQQSTDVYPTADDATRAMTTLLDALERCEQQVDGDQVTVDYTRTSIPEDVGLGARGVRGTMTVQSTGVTWPHRLGCMIRGPVVQCVMVWSRTEATSQEWFDAGLLASADNLRARIPE
jgi:hypothetical protein